MPTEVVVAPIAEQAPKPRVGMPLRLGRAIVCIGAAFGAVLVHGYHPFAVDGAIYAPAIKKLLHPNLYPQHSQYFLFPAKDSIFAELMAISVRATHLPLPYVLLLWQIGSIALLLAVCWRLGRLCLRSEWQALYGMLLLASLLTIPVAGTSLILVDPYLTSRSLSTPAVLLAICCVLEIKLLRAGLWLAVAALVHPLMAMFGGAFAIMLYAVENRNPRMMVGIASAWFAAAMGAIWWARGETVTPAYRAAVMTRTYFFLSQWTWYEIVGLIAPLVLFAGMLLAQRKGPHAWEKAGWDTRAVPFAPGASLLTTSLLFGSFFFLLGIAVDVSAKLLPLARFQPLRAFHLLYVLLILLPMTTFVTEVTRRRRTAALVLLAVVSAGMFLIQRQTFPASTHVEWPWSHSRNNWVQAFEWVRANTPKDAVFALDGDYTNAPGEDCQGFEAWAERSSLPDVAKDGGVAALFPDIAEDWARQTAATASLGKAAGPDAQALAAAGVSWTVIRRARSVKLDCPYQNSDVAVCRLKPN